MFGEVGGIQHWLTRDYFPFLRPYLRWTRRPATWLGGAALATLLIGVFVQPLGLWLSGGIGCAILLGFVWPWLAMRGITCRLSFSKARATEGQSVTVRLTLVNRWPWPLWGLAIVGGFRADTEAGEDQEGLPIAMALAVVPPWSETNFHADFVPRRRGRYPMGIPYVTTGFPFGLWRPRRVVTVEKSLIAWPRRYSVPPVLPDVGFDQIGLGLADGRPGDAGDFNGVRPYRQGDTLRRIHWPQTAKHGRLIVCERQAPTQVAVHVFADLRRPSPQVPGQEDLLEATIRAVASLCVMLHQQNALVAYSDAEVTLDVRRGYQGLAAILDRLASIPWDGLAQGPWDAQFRDRRVATEFPMLEVLVTGDRDAARVLHARSGTTSRRCIVVSNDDESVCHQWEAICRDA